MDENVFVSIAEAANQKLVIGTKNESASLKPNVHKTTKATTRRPLATLAFCEIKSHLNVIKKNQCKINVKKVSPKLDSLQPSNGNKKVMKEKLKESEKNEKLESKKADVKINKTSTKLDDKENDNQIIQSKENVSIAQKSHDNSKNTQNNENDKNISVNEKVQNVTKQVKVNEKVCKDKEEKKEEMKSNSESKEENQVTEKDLLSNEKLNLELENKENICPDHNMSEIEESSLMCVDVIDTDEIDSYSDRYLFYQCPEYSQDIYRYLLKCQERYKPDPNYMSKQKEINIKMRSILIDWMVEVTEEYKMTPETLFLAVNFIDRFLSTMGISRQNFQLLGTTALFISSKYEEIYPPEITEFVYITDDAYTKHQVLGMEKVLLRALKFDVSAPTIHYFLRKYLIDINLNQVIGILSEYICYLCIIEVNPTLYFLPNDIAIAAILLASYLCGQSLQNNVLIRTTLFPNISDQQLKAELLRLKPLIETLQHLLRVAKSSPQQAVYYKYSTERFFSVASIVVSNTPIQIT